MEVTTVSHGLAIVLAVTGRLDAETVTPFGARLFDLIAEGHRRIIVNLAGLGYINSAGLRGVAAANAGRDRPPGLSSARCCPRVFLMTRPRTTRRSVLTSRNEAR